MLLAYTATRDTENILIFTECCFEWQRYQWITIWEVSYSVESLGGARVSLKQTCIDCA